MTNASVDDRENPFSDPVNGDDQSNGLAQSTLVIGRDVSLSLGADSLVILDANFEGPTFTRCCGLWPSRPKSAKAIPFFNVLWASISDQDLAIQYAQTTSKSKIHVTSFHYFIEKPSEHHAISWVGKLLDRAYGQSQRQKRIKVLINPFGGQGAAQKYYNRDIEPIFAAARCEIDVERTRHQGHAVEIAENLDIEAFDVVASCSGDGLPHEVFNGLGRRPDAGRALRKVAVVQLPCGTGNAMSLNLNGTNDCGLAALCIVKGIRMPLDLVSITQAGKRSLSFLSQALGIVAETDLGTDNLRWMGSLRFTYGFLARILGKTMYPCEIDLLVEVPTKSEIKEHYRNECISHNPAANRQFSDEDHEGYTVNEGLPPLQYGSPSDPLPSGFITIEYPHLGTFYAGNMTMMAPDAYLFPAALPSDGLMDVITVRGDIPRIPALKTFLAANNANKFFEMEYLIYSKVKAYRVRPRQSQPVVSVDGERAGFEAWAAEVHRGLGTTLSRRGGFESKGL